MGGRCYMVPVLGRMELVKGDWEEGTGEGDNYNNIYGESSKGGVVLSF